MYVFCIIAQQVDLSHTELAQQPLSESLESLGTRRDYTELGVTRVTAMNLGAVRSFN